MSRFAVLVLVLLCAVPAAAQAPFPGAVRVGDGWVPCDHPIAIRAGLGCTAKVPTLSTPTRACVAVGAVSVCDYAVDCVPKADPYKPAESARAAACAGLWTLEHPEPPMTIVDFVPGRTYEAPYGYRMKVLTTSATSAGDAAITCEWLLGNGGMRPANGAGVGDVFAFLASSRFAKKWWEAPAVDAEQ